MLDLQIRVRRAIKSDRLFCLVNIHYLPMLLRERVFSVDYICPSNISFSFSKFALLYPL